MLKISCSLEFVAERSASVILQRDPPNVGQLLARELLVTDRYRQTGSKDQRLYAMSGGRWFALGECAAPLTPSVERAIFGHRPSTTSEVS